MEQGELITLAKSIAASMGLYPPLICAIIERESTWRTDVTRYEAAYKIKYVDPKHYPETEATLRSTSWGLMQILGDSARVAGCTGNLQELIDPNLNLYWGCLWFIHKMLQAKGIIDIALEDWNGGSNKNYYSEVEGFMPKYV
jgi:soluble lytic murein transglycosylase-like protein